MMPGFRCGKHAMASESHTRGSVGGLDAHVRHFGVLVGVLAYTELMRLVSCPDGASRHLPAIIPPGRGFG